MITGRTEINLSVPKESVTDSSALLLWQSDTEEIESYTVYLNGENVADTAHEDYTLEQLKEASSYEAYVEGKLPDGGVLRSSRIRIVTKPQMQTVNVLDYGAVGDGVTLNTTAIQEAIDACPLGGIVVIPEGIFVSGALYLKSNMTLSVEKGGKLLGSSRLEDFPLMRYRWEGLETECYASLINTKEASGNENIAIVGAGTIDANGSVLRKQELAQKKGKPGRAVCLRGVQGLYLKDITIRQSPAWCLHTIYCTHVTLNRINVHTKFDEQGNRYPDIANGDGFDPDSCSDVRVIASMIASQDDCIAIKSGRDREGREVGIASENIRVSHCRFKSGFGVAVGSEMSGCVRNVLVRDCVFENVYSAVSIKAPRGRGAVVENIRYENITQYYHETQHTDCKWFRGAIYVDTYYSHDEVDLNEREPEGEDTPTIRNVFLKNICADTVAGNALYLSGLPERPLKNIYLENITGRGIYGMKINHVEGLHMKNVNILTR